MSQKYNILVEEVKKLSVEEKEELKFVQLLIFTI
jgi:hypothetical protein